MTESAQVFKGVHDTPVYTDLLFHKPLRMGVAIPAAIGLTLTFVLTMRMLDSGHARSILLIGLALTATASGIFGDGAIGSSNRSTPTRAMTA